MRRAGAAMLAAMLAGCSGEPPTPAASPTPVPTPTATASLRVLKPDQLPSPELDAARPIAGRWRFQASAIGAAAVYEADGAPLFAVRCDPQARRIMLVRAGGGGATRLFTEVAAATFPAKPFDGMAESSVTTGLTFLDALAGADGIGMAAGDGPVLRVPGDAAIGDVVRSCRPGIGR